MITGGELCDFGFTFESDPEQATINIKPPENFKWGQCGTAEYSAPELYGKRHFKGDYYMLDVWCMGCILYQLHFRKPLPWKIDIDENQKHFDTVEKKFTDKNALKLAQETITQKIRDTIETPFATLSVKKILSSEEKFELLTYKMMRLLPGDRIEIPEALQTVTQLVMS